MSIVLPSNTSLKRLSTDRFAPSRSLQDAKERLGPSYYDSRLVECPQNAIELAKLLQTLDDIEKEKFKAKQNNIRSQRLLMHNLQTRYSFPGACNRKDLKVTDVKLPPAGFRYHADGTPKLRRVSIGTPIDTGYETSQSDSTSTVSSECVVNRVTFHNSEENVTCRSSKFNEDIKSDDDSSNEGTKMTVQTTTRVASDKDLLRVSSKLIKQIQKELDRNKCDIQSHASSREKQAKKCHSVKFYSTPPPLPVSDIFHKKPSNNIDRKISVIKSNCKACQHNAKHSGETFKMLQESLSKKQLTPWKIAPQGKLLENKQFSGRSITSSRDLAKLTWDSKSKSVRSNKDNEFHSLNQINKRRTSSAHPKLKTSAPIQLGSGRTSSPFHRCSSVDVLKQQIREEQESCECKVQDFLRRLKSTTEKPKIV